jgi:hypothetical protein
MNRDSCSGVDLDSAEQVGRCAPVSADIEINTNAGGALLNAVLSRAQQACCPAVQEAFNRAPRTNGNLTRGVGERFEQFQILRRNPALRGPVVACHTQNTAVERTFVQFYPTLLEVARNRGTLKPGFAGQ